MDQEQLFIETREHCVLALAQRIGGTKKLAALMWPNDSIDAAHKRLLAKIDDGRREVLSAEDWDSILRVGADHECHIAKWWQDDTVGYQRSQPSEPKDTDEQLAATIDAATKTLAKALDIYSRRQGVAELRKVK